MPKSAIDRWEQSINPSALKSAKWEIGSGGSWDMSKVQPIPDAMLAELTRAFAYSGTPWNCRSLPLSESDREYMYLLYYSMQGLVSRMRLAERNLHRVIEEVDALCKETVYEDGQMAKGVSTRFLARITNLRVAAGLTPPDQPLAVESAAMFAHSGFRAPNERTE